MLMMKDHVSGHGTTLRVQAVQTIQGPPDEKKKREKAEDDPNRTGRAFFGDDQAQDPEWWQEEDLVWWSKGKSGKSSLSKGNDGFHKGGFRPYQPYKGAGKDQEQRQGKGSKMKRQGRNISSIRILGLRNTPKRRIWLGLGIRRLVCQSLE